MSITWARILTGTFIAFLSSCGPGAGSVSGTVTQNNPTTLGPSVTAQNDEIIANGVASASIVIVLRDANNDPIVGEVPTFSATDSGTTNTYGACTLSNANGVSTCSLTSTFAEKKYLQVLTPVSIFGGPVEFIAGPANASNTTITGTGPVIANGNATSVVTVSIFDAFNNPVQGEIPVFSASGSANAYGTCSLSNASGTSICSFASSFAEVKNLALISPVAVAGGTVTFVPASVHPSQTTISGSGPVVANGVATSSVTVTLGDAFGNPVSGVTPTFSTTGTGNTQTACTASNGSGVSTCTLASTVAETKTLSLLTPFALSGGSVTFVPGAASALTSTIGASSPVSADGLSSSVVTVALRDANNNVIVGLTPTFSSSGTGNTLGACSVTNVLGVSSCTLRSTVAETKTISLVTPVVVAGGSVTFVSGTAVAANTTISGTTSIAADGVSTSAVTVTLLDSQNNPISGIVPTFSASGSGNSYGACSESNSSGVSTCTLASTRAETKTLQLTSPIIKTGTNVTFVAGLASALASSIVGSGPVVANGVSTSTITVVLADSTSNPLSGIIPTFSVSGTGNSQTACSASNTSGISTCTLTSTVAETKNLALLFPLAASGGAVSFVAGAAVAANSNIIGSGPVPANGVAASNVTVTLADAFNNPISGVVPSFSATDTNSGNSYGACSSTDSSGVASCTLKSTVSETKTLSLLSPVADTGGDVSFVAGTPNAIVSSISASGPVVANGVSTSTVTVTLADANFNPIVGTTPTFSATDTNSGNTYGACSASNGSGVSTCTLSSTVAENKEIFLTSPFSMSGNKVLFIPGAANALTSTITGSGPVSADGVHSSTVTVRLRDANSNFIVGVTPTFSATGTSNTLTTCTSTDVQGVATCALQSTVAETKTLSLVTPVAVAGGSVTFTSGAAVAANTTLSGTSSILANGVATSAITVTLLDATSNAVSGVVPTFSATGSGNTYGACSVSDASGVSTCTLASTSAETKTLQLTSPIIDTGTNVTFIAGAPSAVISSITGSGPVTANGVATSTVTIVLADAQSNPIVGTTPTFSATDTGSTNVQTACSVSDASGVSTCTLSSEVAETKTLSLLTPVAVTGGTLSFVAGAAVAGNSNISGTGPVLANGIAASTVTVTVADAFNNPIAGTIPTFSATDTSTGNSYGACSASDSSGTATCTLKSTVAETKTLSLLTPVADTGGTVTFNPGLSVAAHTTIAGSGPVVADGVATSTVTVSLGDAFGNPVSGITPTFAATGTGNSQTACSVSNGSGVSTCTLSSTVAETKTLALSTPFALSGGTVSFVPAAVSAATSTIAASGPVTADGVSSSLVTVTLRDANNNVIVGTTPTFSSTGSGNTVGTCSVTNALGVSSCSLQSTVAEAKTISLATPVVVAGGSVSFVAGPAVASTSNITGTTSIAADGVATSTITVTLLDANSNAIVGIVPTFGATNTGSGNIYGACSISDAAGESTCTLASTRAETKLLQITSPLVDAGGSVTFVPAGASATVSSIVGSGPIVANGVATSTVTVLLADASSNPISGVVPTFATSGTGNTQSVCSASSASGVSTCTVSSTVAETKTLSLLTPVAFVGGSVEFVPDAASAVTSTIVGSGPVAADGTSTSTITVTLRDANNNNISGAVPTFSATDTGATNVYGACSASNTSGVSTCTLASSRAEVKTLSLLTPVAFAGGSVTFTGGAPSAIYSDISGTGPVVANGVATSTITISLMDATNNPVAGVTPTFSATDTGVTNAYSACTLSDAFGVSTCTLTSTYAETKTLAIASPIADIGSTVSFTSNGVDLQVPIEMLGTAVINNAVSTVDYALSSTAFNLANYTASTNTIYFEIIYTSTAAVGTVSLVNSANAVVAGSSIVTAINANPTRARTAAIASLPTDTYRVRLVNSGANTLTVFGARIIIEQDNATATEIYIPLANGLFSTGSATVTNAIATTVSTGFTQNAIGVNGPDRFSYFRRDDSRYATIASGSPWTLETVVSNSVAAASTTVALYNATTDQAVSGASVAGVSPGANTIVLSSVSFASSATNFSDLSNYEVKYRSSAGANTARLHKATLRLRLTDLTKADVPWRISMANSVVATATMSHQKMLYEGNRFSNPRLYLEMTGRFSVPSTGNFIELADSGVTDTAIAGTAVPGSFITMLGSKGRDRTSRFDAPLNNQRLIVQQTRTSGTLITNNSFLIVAVDQL